MVEQLVEGLTLIDDAPVSYYLWLVDRAPTAATVHSLVDAACGDETTDDERELILDAGRTRLEELGDGS